MKHEEVFFAFQSRKQKEQVKELHSQFGHSTAEQLKKLWKDAVVKDCSAIRSVDEVTNGCFFLLEIQENAEHTCCRER